MQDLNALSKYKVQSFIARLKQELNRHSHYQEYKNLTYKEDKRTDNMHVIHIIAANKPFKIIIEAGKDIMKDKAFIELYQGEQLISDHTTGFITELLNFDNQFMISVIQKLIEKINLY